MPELFNGVVVVGSGLSASSAAMSVLENGVPVMIIEKEKRLGGNSLKAWAGYNGCCTSTQADKNIKDSVELFAADTAFSAFKTHNVPANDLQVRLAADSGPGHAWLQGYGIKLPVLSQNGGHSAPRTHRPTKGGAGSYITQSLLRKLKKNDQCTIINQSEVCELLTNASGGVTGVKYRSKDGSETSVKCLAVVLASGGFAGGVARQAQKSILNKYRPDLVDLPTSNPASATGDGMLIAEKIGAELMDMEYVQVHPTGFIDPNNPEEKELVLATEALRGHGALLINKDGRRFVNEIWHRDWVSEAEKTQRGSIYIVMNSGVAKDCAVPFVKQYTALGLLQHFGSGAEFCNKYNIPYKNFAETLAVYNEAAKRGYSDCGKNRFENTPFFPEDKYVVGIVTPLLHYVMGGVRINKNAEVLKKSNQQPIPALFGAGETTGGVHRKNRLAGNSLVDCVVYGRVAGNAAAKFAKSNRSRL